MFDIVGRYHEKKIFDNMLNSKKSEFLALYGRRRIGKTFLIRTYFDRHFTFQLTGLGNATSPDQLLNFELSLKQQYPKLKSERVINWLEAFEIIKKLIVNNKKAKKVIFIDELPWLATPKSGFLQALEHFWNSWASARKDVLLIVCGSAASWMINELINNKGGLHNRVTQKIKIEPFTLNECELFIKSKKIVLERYQIVQLYMVLGGVPFYWEAVEKGLSATQNIDKICFSKNGLLLTEFPNLFKSLFNKDDKHQNIVEVLASKAQGMTRIELIKRSKLSNGGSITRLLNELEESGFIQRYMPYGKLSRNSIYQLTDFYSLFYFKFIKAYSLNDKNYWAKLIDNPKHRAWSGYAFEQVCMAHIQQIKIALGISGVETITSSWRSNINDNNVQIDLVIDRRDMVVNICEMKYAINPYLIDKKYDSELRNKIGVFKAETKTRKAVFLTLITTFGLQENSYSNNIQNSITMDALFKA